MRKADWACRFCSQPNEGDEEVCRQCTAARSASIDEVKEASAGEDPVVYISKPPAPASPSSHPVSPGYTSWWEHRPGPVESACLVAPVGACFGVAAALIGVVGTTNELTAGDVLQSALIGGATASVLYLKGFRRSQATRRDLVVFGTLVAVSALGLALLQMG